MSSWSEDSEEEYEDEAVKNEEPLPKIDEIFRNNMVALKHSLYDNIVLSPELGTKNAQSNEVLQHYLDKLDNVYVLCLNAGEGGVIQEEDLLTFPKETRDILRTVLYWIRDFFSKNEYAVTIPYLDYLEKSLREYQFVQNNSFERE